MPDPKSPAANKNTSASPPFATKAELMAAIQQVFQKRCGSLLHDLRVRLSTTNSALWPDGDRDLTEA